MALGRAHPAFPFPFRRVGQPTDSLPRCAEHELREIFTRFGQVQTCIVNKDKRHAFVKMYYRKDAERAKAGMEEARTQDFQLRVSSSP